MDPIASSTILIVDDEPVSRKALHTILRSAGYRICVAANGREALSALETESIDLVILDIVMPDMSGFEVLKRMQSHPEHRQVPAIAVSALDDLSDIEQALETGAQDYICKPVTGKASRIQLALKVRNLLRLRTIQKRLDQNLKQAERLSRIDDITNLFNYRHFRERLSAEFERSVRYGRALSLIVIDLDHLKPVNDEYGHNIGTGIISMAGNLLEKGCRAVDIPVRYGGDEFCIIAPETELPQAASMSERLRADIEAFGRTLELGGIFITASLGIAAQHGRAPFPSEEALLKAADDACYRAKRAGRNRVYCFNNGGFSETGALLTTAAYSSEQPL